MFTFTLVGSERILNIRFVKTPVLDLYVTKKEKQIEEKAEELPMVNQQYM